MWTIWHIQMFRLKRLIQLQFLAVKITKKVNYIPFVVCNNDYYIQYALILYQCNGVSIRGTQSEDPGSNPRTGVFCSWVEFSILVLHVGLGLAHLSWDWIIWMFVCPILSPLPGDPYPDQSPKTSWTLKHKTQELIYKWIIKKYPYVTLVLNVTYG